PLFSRSCYGGQSLYWDRLFFLFRGYKLRRLGSGDPGLAATLDVAAWARGSWCGFVLCIYVGGRRKTEAIPRKESELTTSWFVLDSLRHGRDSCRVRRFVKSLRIILCHSVGVALYVGRERWPVEPP